MQIDVRVGRDHSRFKRLVHLPDRAPIVGNLPQGDMVQSRLPRMKPQRLNQAVQVRLRRHPRHRSDRRIGNIQPRLRRFENSRRLHAAHIVRVEVDRNPDLLLQRFDQLLGRVRLAQPGHVLNGEDVRAHPLQFLGQLDVVRQVVLLAGRVEDVGRVADGRLADHPCIDHRLHRHLHVRHPVQGIEHAKDIDPRLGRFFHELADNIVRVVRVAHGVRGA